MRTLLAFPLLALMACAPTSPEAKVKAAFDACVKGVEEGDAGAVMERLDSSFRGPEGMDRSGAKLYLMAVLRREKIGVTVLSSRIEVQRNSALQTVEVLLTSRNGSGLLPQDASRRTFQLRWEATQEVWRLREIQDQTAP